MRTEYDNGSRNIAALARKYGVARTTASGIINRTSWFYT
jgi:Mor family transcriptional regulator